MQAIATLTQDDPYLKLPRQARIAARVERRSRLFGVTSPVESIASSVTNPEPQIEPDQSWIERQKKTPLPKEPWFSIVAEIEPQEPRRPTIKEIQRAVAKYYGVARVDLLCARRTIAIMRPRQVGYFLSKELTLFSLPQIGRQFGDRDHSTILSGVRKITRLKATDATLAEEICALTDSLMRAA